MKIDTPINPIPLRTDAYWDIGDQLDAIIKGFMHLQAQGIDIGVDMAQLVAHTKQVKSDYKKG